MGVNLQKLCISTSIISKMGSDEYGQMMLQALKKEGLDISNLKVGEGRMAITYMTWMGLTLFMGIISREYLRILFLMRRTLGLSIP